MSKPKKCNVCGRATKYKSVTGKCLSCGMNKNIAVVKQLRTKKGKYYKKWKKNLLKGVK